MPVIFAIGKAPKHRVPSLALALARAWNRLFGFAIFGGPRQRWRGRQIGRPRAILRCITNLRREAFDVRMAKLPQRLPHPPPVLEPRVLHEVGLPDVAADRREEVHERLQREKRR